MIDKIFLTLFLDGGELPARYPPMFHENMASLKKQHPQANVTILSLNEARTFIGRHFEADVLETLDTLAPYACKSDLVRYALMYVHGGLYTDVGIRWVRPLPVTADTRLLVFKDMPQPCSWSVNQAVIYAQPGRPEFLEAIRLVVANVKARDYGADPLCPTGPNAFGRAVAAEGRLGEIVFGSHRFLTPGEGFESPAFLVDGELIALKFKHRHGDISSLGFVGANNYNDYWRARRVFGEAASRWSFRDLEISCEGATRIRESVVFSPGVKGIQTYGPYLQLEPGAYEVSLAFAPPGFAGRLGVEVTADHSKRTLAPHRTFAPQDLHASTLRFPLVLDGHAPGVEIRTYNEGDLSGALREIAVERTRA
jgi:hypothetical protein